MNDLITITNSLTTIPARSIPAAFQVEMLAQLRPGEEVVTWFEPNLDARLRFGSGIVFLTNLGVIARQPTPPNEPLAPWRKWDLAEIREIKKLDRTGLGILELLGEKHLLQAWRFTTGNTNYAALLASKAKLLKAGKSEETELSETICPSCGGSMLVGQMVCSNCAPAPSPDTNRSLWRLTRFAKPQAPMILVGFALTLLSTAATFLAAYLTKLLIDVLAPPKIAVNELASTTEMLAKPIDFRFVPWLLAGMLMASLLSWLLVWAKTFTLASVSEQISADLRISTYSHLQKLSLEFFGGKRTGDLISRISNDTQRICDFLSISLVDFATDILLIVFTACFLFY
ncbi:MAG TPA: ABC transporter transmembrane domain-containing protein, partial [Pirellula sp.]|nr:ABC transporter transmembrane domain-containing protein [Pirellula sp.]